jgi:hypothetical protein
MYENRYLIPQSNNERDKIYKAWPGTGFRMGADVGGDPAPMNATGFMGLGPGGPLRPACCPDGLEGRDGARGDSAMALERGMRIFADSQDS